MRSPAEGAAQTDAGPATHEADPITSGELATAARRATANRKALGLPDPRRQASTWSARYTE
ncbi:hypothetical protein AB0G04_07070 [Actinoplanes sp. NPDC023801]|uniref:hypothetical protein n=1 Tax=Actinoplanes sp. NPDC023801 TaxID=3154595 RepID=UPI0033C3B66A